MILEKEAANTLESQRNSKSLKKSRSKETNIKIIIKIPVPCPVKTVIREPDNSSWEEGEEGCKKNITMDWLN